MFNPQDQWQNLHCFVHTMPMSSLRKSSKQVSIGSEQLLCTQGNRGLPNPWRHHPSYSRASGRFQIFELMRSVNKNPLAMSGDLERQTK